MSISPVVAQSVERATPGEEVPGSLPAVTTRPLLVGSVSDCQYNVTGWDRSHGLPNLSRVWQHIKLSDVSLDDKLNWQMHSSAVRKKLNRRMFFLRKLRSLKIDAIILSLFYRSTIQRILSFCIAAW